MTPGEPTAQWENQLRPWRLAAGLMAIAQLPAIVAVILVVFLFDESYKAWAYVAGGAIILLELAQWAIAREALRRRPSVTRQLNDLYSTLPLDRGQRQLVTFNLALGVIGPALIVAAIPTTSFDGEAVIAAALIAVAVAPGFLSLHRVRRHNSWLAISRLGARPRHPPRPAHGS
jgi:hypothetical protein